MKFVICIFLVSCVLFLGISAEAASPQVRIKDLGHILEARQNQLMGFGLVVGLRNSGDSQQTGFTKQAMTNLLSKMGLVPQIDFRSRNVAAVMVTAALQPYVKNGQRIDVTVSSMGDAKSLQGGTLLITPLMGVDSEIYAVAQGNILVGRDEVAPNLPPIRSSNSTVGRIPNGALVEKEVPVSLADKGSLTIVLDEPDYTTAVRMAAVIAKAGYDATAVDAASITIPVYGSDDAVKIMAKIENLTLTPDTVARVVVNERTGTVVIGDKVKISDVAVAYGGISINVGPMRLYSEGTVGEGADEGSSLRTRTTANLTRKSGKLVQLRSAATLSDLVKALNAIKASPQDLIAVLQALKKAGALKAELEVI